MTDVNGATSCADVVRDAEKALDRAEVVAKKASSEVEKAKARLNRAKGVRNMMSPSNAGLRYRALTPIVSAPSKKRLVKELQLRLDAQKANDSRSIREQLDADSRLAFELAKEDQKWITKVAKKKNNNKKTKKS